jgi:hypothetical protein
VTQLSFQKKGSNMAQDGEFKAVTAFKLLAGSLSACFPGGTAAEGYRAAEYAVTKARASGFLFEKKLRD